MFKTFQGFLYNFCESQNLSELVQLTSIFSHMDFNMATKTNLTDPKDWLLYDTGFVLKMKKK